MSRGTLFFIRTSNFGAEDERSYFCGQFEPEKVLKLPVFTCTYADVTKTPIKEQHVP